ncbi:UDP-glucose 4-epimerase GalE [Bdellovibrio sp. HCB2-146]|uniref:UDP-glucose 4-epimerase GalE n=1 Tax=Bdellovibrio sp. HCB2-146 TaxID=3394362 RepID=UPI0039BD2D97
MKILVTGGAGYIGSHTTNQLFCAGHEVVVFDNLSTGFRDAIRPGVKFVQGDVRDIDLLEKTITENAIQAVVHFAAKLIVSESVGMPIEYYENNTIGVISLMSACRRTGVNNVVFSSTAAVYGDVRQQGLISESQPNNPINPYGRSKLMSEAILRDCEAAYGIRTVVLRYFNVAGASADGLNGQRTKNATHLVKIASEAAVGKRRKMNIFGTDYPTADGTCVRDYIHVEDLADVHVLALDYLSKGNKGVTINCGYGHGYSVREVIDVMKKVTGVDFVVEEATRRVGDPASLVASSEKASSVLGWKPQYDSLELICKSAADWEKRMTF